MSDNDANTLYITKVVGDVAISPKSDVPSFQKKVQDTNDTTGDTSGWQDSADYDVNDKVPFQLKATLPKNYTDYKTYYLAFHDVEETGLSFNVDSVKVAVDGVAVDASKYMVKTAGFTDGCTFEVVFTDLKTAVAAAKNDSVITVDYTSTLTEQAVLGNQVVGRGIFDENGEPQHTDAPQLPARPPVQAPVRWLNGRMQRDWKIHTFSNDR